MVVVVNLAPVVPVVLVVHLDIVVVDLSFVPGDILVGLNKFLIFFVNI